MGYNDYKNKILLALESDPNFKEKFVNLLNKKDDSDKDIDIHIGLPPISVEDNKIAYTIATGKRRNEYSFTSLQSLSLSRRLIKELHQQLGDVIKKENIE